MEHIEDSLALPAKMGLGFIKYSSLIAFGINYDRKKFYDTGPQKYQWENEVLKTKWTVSKIIFWQPMNSFQWKSGNFSREKIFYVKILQRN